MTHVHDTEGRRRHARGPFGPPWDDRGFRGGRHRGKRARRGDVRAAILSLLAEEPRNGYQVMQEIEARSGGIWRPSPGSVYPALQQLEDEGLIRAEEHDGGKRFTLTDDGSRFVAEHEKELEAPWNAVREDVSEDELNLREVMRQLAPAVYQVAQVGNSDQIAEAKRLLAETRRGLYRILAEGNGE